MMGWLTIILLTLLARIKSENQTCKLIGQTGFLEFSREGDFNIVGIFSMTNVEKQEGNSYRAVPFSYCENWNDRELKFARTMIFTVEEINKDPTLLPGVSLGYRVYNGCGTMNLVRAAVEAINGNDSLQCTGQTLAVIGHSSSGVSEIISSILSSLSVPQLSPLSTCACLSDKTRYPTFFRTVPSEHSQSTALVQLMVYFNWRWVGIIYSESTYAEESTRSFVKEANNKGICVEYWLMYSITSQANFDVIANALKKSSSKVVLMFMSSSYAKAFLSNMESYNITGKQWVGSESWITQKTLVSIDRKHILHGAIGFALPDTSIPGLGEFLLNLKPSSEPQSAIIKGFWEKFFDCNFSPSNTSSMCTGAEDLQTVFSDYTEVSCFREENNIYKAVYSVAVALHSILQCQNDLNHTTKPCLTNIQFQPELVVEYLKYVNFTTKNGAKVFFDENKDSVAQYDLVNWQIKEDGSVEIVQIGQYDNSLPEREKLKLKKNAKIVWGHDSNEVPRSVCREPCPPGTRKALNKNKPVCCFDCLECPEGTISNETNSANCCICPPDLWPNEVKNRCLPKHIECLSYKEIMGALLTGFSTFGMFLSLLTSIIFYTHKETPLVRANNSELSFLLLFSLKLCFLCPLAFIARPTRWSCMLRHTAFSITFVLCISCVLGKAIVVLLAFKAKLPGNNVNQWFGPPQQRISILSFTLIQVFICTRWFTKNPPFPHMNMDYYKDRIVLECALGSTAGFWAVLGYIGLLAALCFIFAFLARKLPGRFNEARLITFSMLIFCAVWITFIPAYVNSPGKFTVVVEIFAILASSFGLLLCIYAPKCYIILLKPKQNTKKHFLGKVPPRTL